jgi:hypothetical protein
MALAELLPVTTRAAEAASLQYLFFLSWFALLSAKTSISRGTGRTTR